MRVLAWWPFISMVASNTEFQANQIKWRKNKNEEDDGEGAGGGFSQRGKRKGEKWKQNGDEQQSAVNFGKLSQMHQKSRTVNIGIELWFAIFYTVPKKSFALFGCSCVCHCECVCDLMILVARLLRHYYFFLFFPHSQFEYIYIEPGLFIAFIQKITMFTQANPFDLY